MTQTMKDMNMRDEFAMRVLSAIYAEFFAGCREQGVGPKDEHWREGLAIDAYAMADAMIAVRCAGKDSVITGNAAPIKASRESELDLDDVAATSPLAQRELAELRQERDALQQAAAVAWGWLWHVATSDDRVMTARDLLGQFLDQGLKRYGIQTAKAEGAQVNVHEIEAAMMRGHFDDD
jgi:hypothetical protein